MSRCLVVFRPLIVLKAKMLYKNYSRRRKKKKEKDILIIPLHSFYALLLALVVFALIMFLQIGAILIDFIFGIGSVSTK